MDEHEEQKRIYKLYEAALGEDAKDYWEWGDLPCYMWEILGLFYRVKTIDIFGHTIPQPIKDSLKEGTIYYVPYLTSSGYDAKTFTWENSPQDFFNKNDAVIHLTKANAMEHARAVASVGTYSKMVKYSIYKSALQYPYDYWEYSNGNNLWLPLKREPNWYRGTLYRPARIEYEQLPAKINPLTGLIKGAKYWMPKIIPLAKGVALSHATEYTWTSSEENYRHLSQGLFVTEEDAIEWAMLAAEEYVDTSGNKYSTSGDTYKMKHKHAELMKQYAEDAKLTNTPWEYWEYFDITLNKWVKCTMPISFLENTEYRRIVSNQHLHADLMKQYAKDAQISDTPWIFYQHYYDGWIDCNKPIYWESTIKYRRKYPIVEHIYYVPDITNPDNPIYYTWQDDSIDRDLLKKSLVCLDKEEAINKAKKILDWIKNYEN